MLQKLLVGFHLIRIGNKGRALHKAPPNSPTMQKLQRGRFLLYRHSQRQREFDSVHRI